MLGKVSRSSTEPLVSRSTPVLSLAHLASRGSWSPTDQDGLDWCVRLFLPLYDNVTGSHPAKLEFLAQYW